MVLILLEFVNQTNHEKTRKNIYSLLYRILYTSIIKIMNEIQLIVQALNCTIARKKRKLKRAERQLLMCDNDYQQMLTCKSITNLISKIQQFETIKQKYDNTN